MNLALRLARREMRSGLAGFRLFIACLALGVGAIAAILSFSRAVEEGLRADGTTLILITHDMVLAGRCDRILRIADGLVVGDERTPAAIAAQ